MCSTAKRLKLKLINPKFVQSFAIISTEEEKICLKRTPRKMNVENGGKRNVTDRPLKLFKIKEPTIAYRVKDKTLPIFWTKTFDEKCTSCNCPRQLQYLHCKIKNVASYCDPIFFIICLHTFGSIRSLLDVQFSFLR